MSREAAVTHDIQPTSPYLYMVQCYLDLISRRDDLTYGSGLRRLYVLANGLDTYNDEDIIAATEKAVRDKFIPHQLTGLMYQGVAKNCYLYGQGVAEMINDRIVAIANGDVRNPLPQMNWNPAEGRRFFYHPHVSVLKRLKRALQVDAGPDFNLGYTPDVTINEVAGDAEMHLNQLQGNEGYASQPESSYTLISNCVSKLVEVLGSEAQWAGNPNCDYRNRSRSALKILWYFAKLLYGDLTTRPMRKDVNLVDLDCEFRMTDGTLAAIPFPTQRTMLVFADAEVPAGVSIKAHAYLSAVSNVELRKDYILKSEG